MTEEYWWVRFAGEVQPASVTLRDGKAQWVWLIGTEAAFNPDDVELIGRMIPPNA